MEVRTLNRVSLVSNEIFEFSAASAGTGETTPTTRASKNRLRHQEPRGNLLTAGSDGNTTAKCKSFLQNGSIGRSGAALGWESRSGRSWRPAFGAIGGALRELPESPNQGWTGIAELSPMLQRQF